MKVEPPSSILLPELQWIVDHNEQIRGGHRVQIWDAVEAWRTAESKLTALTAALTSLRDEMVEHAYPFGRQIAYADGSKVVEWAKQLTELSRTFVGGDAPSPQPQTAVDRSEP